MIDTSRRQVLRTGLAAGVLGAAGSFAMPAIAQTRPVKFTLAWLAQGTSAFPYVGKEKGFFASRGIDLQISRGFGSVAAAQAIGSGQFDYGLVFAAPMILMIAKGLPLRSLATVDYDATMGVGVLDESPIKDPADLAGRKVGTVPTSAESPFFPAYAERAKLDLKKVELVSVDAKVIERTLTEKQVDAITGIATSSLPVLLSRNIPVRWMLYSKLGMPTYGNNIVSTQAVVDKDPGLAAAVVDALMESLAYTISNPDDASALFFKQVPEAGLAAAGKEFIRIGLGLHRYAIAKPDAMEHGLGWGDPKAYEGLAELVSRYTAEAGAKIPPVETWYSNRLAGKVKLSADEWKSVKANTSEFDRFLA